MYQKKMQLPLFIFIHSGQQYHGFETEVFIGQRKDIVCLRSSTNRLADALHYNELIYSHGVMLSAHKIIKMSF